MPPLIVIAVLITLFPRRGNSSPIGLNDLELEC